MSKPDLGALVERLNTDSFISVEEYGPAGSAPYIWLSSPHGIGEIRLADNSDATLVATFMAKTPIDRRAALKTGGMLVAMAATGCAHGMQRGSSRFPIDFFEHLRSAPRFPAGIDNQYDRSIGAPIASPTWMYVIGVGFFDKDGANYIVGQTPWGHIITMSGFDKMGIVRNQWLTPGYIIGTEGIKKGKADGIAVTEPNTHLDVRLHTIFPNGNQNYTEQINGLLRKIHNPHDHAAYTDSVFTSRYDGRKVTDEAITREAREEFNTIAAKYSAEHIGQLLREADFSGISFIGQVMMVNKAIEFGLVKNEAARREFSDYLKKHGKQKANLFHIYPNPSLPSDTYQIANGDAIQNENEANSIIKSTYQADINRNWDKMLPLIQAHNKTGSVSEEEIILWHYARAYQGKQLHLRSTTYWLAALGLSDMKWASKDPDNKVDLKAKFNWQAFENLRRLYLRMGMSDEASYFAKKVVGINFNYIGPR